MKTTYTILVTFSHPINSLSQEERISIAEYICKHTKEAQAANLEPHQIAILSSLPLEDDRTTVKVEWRPIY